MYKIERMPHSLEIGYVGEKNFRPVEIDMTAWMEKMPEGVPSIVCIRPGETKDDAYIAVTTFEDNILTWVPSDADLGVMEGEGMIQVWLEEEENSSVTKRGKSIEVITKVKDSVSNPSADTPAPQTSFLEQMTELKTASVNAKTAAETAQGKAEDAQEDAEDAAEDAEAYAKGTRDGSAVTSEDPAYHNNAKYYAEQAGTSATSAGTSATNAGTAKENAEAYAVGTRNGTPVTSGDPAYHNNAKYYAEQVDPTSIIDDTAGEGQTGKTWSADKLDEEFGDVLNAITKLNDTLDNVVTGTSWVLGTLSPGTGIEQASTTRIRSEYIEVTPKTKVHVSGLDYCLIVYAFNKKHEYISDSGWADGNDYAVQSGTKYIRILIRKNPTNGEISSNEISEQASRCSVTLILPSAAYFGDDETDRLQSEINLTNRNLENSQDRIDNLDGIAYLIDENDFNIGTYYYTDSGNIYTAESAKRMCVDKKIHLNAGDFVWVNPLATTQLYLIKSKNDSYTDIVVWTQSSVNISDDADYYISVKDSQNRNITESIAKEMFNNIKICANGYGNLPLMSGEDWSIDLSNGNKTNYFNRYRLISAYITWEGVFTTNSGNRALWVKLLPNKIYNLILGKVEENGATIALYKEPPINGSQGTGKIEVSGTKTTHQETIKTTDEYYYLAVKYGAGADTRYTLSDVLDSIKINIVSGEVNQKTEKISNYAKHISGGSGTPLTIAHFSDLHGDKKALMRIMEGIRNLNNVDEVICTGDMTLDTYEQISSWWDSKVLTCIGNHDTASYSGGSYDWTALSMANRDAYYIAPFESGWGITHTSGTSYYYKDYSDAKVRLIVMDAMLYTSNGTEATAQTTWLENLLADAITNNLHVLIAVHSPHGGAVAEDCSFSRYNQNAMPTNSDCNTPQAVIDAVATKITGGLKFIGYIVGHTHQDNIWDAENNGKQLMYCITCAHVSNKAQWVNSDQYRDVYNDAFNLVTIDTTHTLVKIIRCGGADMDDHMRKRKQICIDYSTGTIVSE